jgi:hypothetical protein
MSVANTRPAGASTATAVTLMGCVAADDARNVASAPPEKRTTASRETIRIEFLASSKTPQPEFQSKVGPTLFVKSAVDHTPVPASTAVPAGQRPGHAQSVGGAAPPGQAEPAAQGDPPGVVLPAPHPQPGAAVQGAEHAALLAPAEAPNTPAGHGRAEVPPGQ